MLFLKKSGATYAPANPYYPDFPALPSEPTEFRSAEITDRVFEVLSAVIASADASAVDKWEVLNRYYAIPDNNRLFVASLLAGVHTAADPDIRRRMQAELIGRNEISEFPDVCSALLADTLSTAQKAVILYEIGQRLKNEKALPGLAQLLKSTDPQVRVASAQAMWHISSRSSIRPLIDALNDQNSDVQYYAIRALADITGEFQWGPSPGEYHEHEAKYRQHWLDWAGRTPKQ